MFKKIWNWILSFFRPAANDFVPPEPDPPKDELPPEVVNKILEHLAYIKEENEGIPNEVDIVMSKFRQPQLSMMPATSPLFNNEELEEMYQEFDNEIEKGMGNHVNKQ